MQQPQKPVVYGDNIIVATKAVLPIARLSSNFSAQSKTCEMSLYLQTSASYHLCRRQVFCDPQAPIFQKFGTVWVYYFSTLHSVTLQCRNVSGQTSCNELLVGAGLLHNTANCYISSDEIQVFPELSGETSKTRAIETIYRRGCQ